VRHARFDVDEIAGLIFDHLFQARSEFVANFSFDDVQDHFEADVNMRVRDAAWRDRSDVCRQFCRSHVLARHALFVMNAVPVASRAAAANG
jgi:hypothetical protein